MLIVSSAPRVARRTPGYVPVLIVSPARLTSLGRHACCDRSRAQGPVTACRCAAPIRMGYLVDFKFIGRGPLI
jgi:hypothetical protein